VFVVTFISKTVAFSLSVFEKL